LFATEAFESFNAIIRAKSVHSNRHAPSRDIALAFAQGNRVRHLLSGSLFNIQSLIIAHTQASGPSVATPVTDPISQSDSQTTRPVFSHNAADWKCAGFGPRGLVHLPNTVTRYLGLDDKKEPKSGQSFYVSFAHSAV
jgi:hypothetical protein